MIPNPQTLPYQSRWISWRAWRRSTLARFVPVSERASHREVFLSFEGQTVYRQCLDSQLFSRAVRVARVRAEAFGFASDMATLSSFDTFWACMIELIDSGGERESGTSRSGFGNEKRLYPSTCTEKQLRFTPCWSIVVSHAPGIGSKG